VGLSFAYLRQRSDVLEKELGRIRQAADLLDQARQAEDADKLDDAHIHLAAAESALDALPELVADGLRREVRRRRQVVEARLRRRNHGRGVRERLTHFQSLRNTAFFHDTLFTGLDLAANLRAARVAAHDALALWCLDEGGDLALLERDRPDLGAEEHRQLVVDCYELLLVWAEVEAQQGPQGALAILARAGRLGTAHGLHTNTYAVRKRLYEAWARGERPARPRIVPAAGGGAALDWFQAGLEDYRAGDYNRAAQACAEAARLRPGHFWARYVEGLCHLRAGRWVEGKAALTVCLDRRPDFVWARLLRGFAAGERGVREKVVAEAEFRSARADFDQALAGKAEALVRHVGLVNRGALAIHRGRWAEAVTDLKEAIALNPNGYQARLNLAQALVGQKKEAEALAVLDEAVRRPPEVALVREARGLLLRRLGRADDARLDFQKVIALGPPTAVAVSRLELGQLFEKAGKHDAALAQYDAVLAAQPKHPLAQRLRAYALLALGRRAEAAEALDRYLAQAPNPAAAAYHARGLLHAGAGRHADAVEMYTLALRLAPDDLAVRRDRAWAYLAQDAARPALADFERCLKQQPDSALALAGRGNALVRLRRVDEALADAEAARAGVGGERLLYQVACIYSLAVAHLELEAGGPRDAGRAERARLLQGKGVACLRQALVSLAPEKRTAFWRRQAHGDPALAALRSHPEHARLARLYQR
jgi:tetratricopeptide (TPR) repeat protein